MIIGVSDSAKNLWFRGEIYDDFYINAGTWENPNKEWIKKVLQIWEQKTQYYYIVIKFLLCNITILTIGI